MTMRHQNGRLCNLALLRLLPGAMILSLAACGGGYGGGGGGGGMATAASATTAAPMITKQPMSVSATAGQTAMFQVVASGGGTLSYQWLRNGAAISKATASAYTTPPLSAADNGSQFAVRISNAYGSVTSSPAMLMVM